ncbi:MAG TPA: hypothetical protein VI636_08355 [Candidatus Angelobacter sp.]
MIRRFYLIYGLGVLGLFATAQYQGWSFASVDRTSNVPNSIRDNPGSYRSIYGSYHHYTGGK